MKNTVYYLFPLLLLITLSIKAQDVSLAHFMHLNPYQLYSNPAADLPYKGYVSIPGISNLNISLNNNALRYNILFERDEEGYPTTITANKFVNCLAKQGNIIAFDLNEEVFGFGFRSDEKLFITFDYRIRANAELSFSKDLLGFFVLGNMNYVGNDNAADMRLGIQATLFQEFGIGFQHKINDKLILGIRPKLLFGAFNLHTQQLQASISTDPGSYAISMAYQAQAKLSSCIPLTMNFSNGNYNFELGYFNSQVIGNAFHNIGGAIDLGITIKPTDKIGISFSALDLGFIRWRTCTYDIHSELANQGQYYDNGSFTFAGLNNEDVNTLTTEGAERILDSLAYYFPLESSVSNAYTTSLYTRLQAEFEYRIDESNRLCVLAQGKFINRKMRPALTMAYNGTFFNILDVCAAYTLQKKSYDNLALGVGVKLGPINLYATTNNIIPIFSLTSLSSASATLGIVVNWF